MTCGSEFHGQHGDDPTYDPMTYDPTMNDPINLDGDSYPFAMPAEALPDAELIPPIGEGYSPNTFVQSAINTRQQQFDLVLNRVMPHTHAPGFDTSIESMVDHLRSTHGLPAPYVSSMLTSWHVNDHPDGVL